MAGRGLPNPQFYGLHTLRGCRRIHRTPRPYDAHLQRLWRSAFPYGDKRVPLRDRPRERRGRPRGVLLHLRFL